MVGHRRVALGILIAVAGCSGAPEPHESDSLRRPEHSPAAPQHGQPARESFAMIRTLTSAFSTSARDQTCVSIRDGRVAAMDDTRCSEVEAGAFCHEDCGAWSNCGGCLMRLDTPASGPWMLEGRPRSSECNMFGGTYRLSEASAQCQGPTPAPSSTTGRGLLLEAHLPSARATVCASFDASGVVSRLDEAECTVATMMHECAPGDCPWLWCGSCLLHVEPIADGKVRLDARVSAGDCVDFAGHYEIDPAAACR